MVVAVAVLGGGVTAAQAATPSSHANRERTRRPVSTRPAERTPRRSAQRGATRASTPRPRQVREQSSQTPGASWKRRPWRPAPRAPPTTRRSRARPTPTTDRVAAVVAGNRFKDNLDGTVTDHLTGLQWEKKTGPWRFRSSARPAQPPIRGLDHGLRHLRVANRYNNDHGELSRDFMDRERHYPASGTFPCSGGSLVAR